MKITILALTALALATAPLAWAQEEETTPEPTPEAAMPEQASSPAKDPSVSVTTEKSPAAEKSSSPAATKSSSPAATKSTSPAKSTSSAPSTKSAPSTAVMPTKKSTPEATLRDIEDKWEASIMVHDPSVAKAYLGNDFRGVSSKGQIMTKSSLLAEIKKDTDTYTSTKNGKVDVRVFGGQFAVVTGTSTEIGKAKDGKAFKRSYRWTDAWVERNGKWECVASQAMQTPK
jgi:ketosteroid isomerase-like protein